MPVLAGDRGVGLMKIRYLLVTCLLVLASGAAHGLGLGEIQVNSRLNQPLDARIAIQEAFPGEADQLTIQTASADDFARVGLERTRLPVSLRFEIEEGARGGKVVKVTSVDPVREPYLGVLLEASWSGGRLLREYGVLLDPPVSAEPSRIVRVDAPATVPARESAPETPATAASPAPAQTAPLSPDPEPVAVQPAPPPAAQAPATPPPAPAPVEEAPRSPPPPGFAPSAAPPPAPVAEPEAATRPAPVPVAADGTYIVQEGDSLSAIAYRLAAEQRVHTSQMMLALQRDNADAFFADNINALKAGAVLRVPEAQAIRALARTEADQEVQRQQDRWAGVERTPELADPGRAPATATPAAASPATPAQARVELLSPRQDGDQGGSTPGASGSQTGDAEMAAAQADLNRTREELSSREREVAELNSRVEDLEEINSQNSRLLELKDAEVAALQRRLAELSQSADAAEAAALTDPMIPAEQDAAPVAIDDPAAGDVLAIDGPETTFADADETEATEAEDLAVTGEEDSVEGATAIDDMDDAQWAAAATDTTTDPFADQADATAAEDSSWAPVDAAPGVSDSDPVAPLADDPPPMAAETSLVSTSPVDSQATPFYKNPLLIGAGLVVIALLLLMVLLSRRQRERAAAAPATGEGGKRSVSDLFASNAAPAAAATAVAADSQSLAEQAAAADDQELRELLDQVQASPDDFDSHVELLSIYYANQDREQFLAWAANLHPRIDHDSPEWQQVVDMGRELAPEATIFADPAPATADTGYEPAPETDARWTPPWSDGADGVGAAAERPVAGEVDDILSLDDEPETADDEPPLSMSSPAASDSADPLAPEPARFDSAGENNATTIDSATPAASPWLEMESDSDRPGSGGDADPVSPLDTGADHGHQPEGAAPEFAPLEFEDSPALPASDSEQPASSPETATDSDSGAGLQADDSQAVELPPLDFEDDEDDAMPANVVDFSEAVAGGDEATTKLELARAYMDMGDPDGAKAMLEEVLGEGDTAQREEARRLLDLL